MKITYSAIGQTSLQIFMSHKYLSLQIFMSPLYVLFSPCPSSYMCVCLNSQCCSPISCTVFFLSCVRVDKFCRPVFKLIIFSALSGLLISPSKYLYFWYHDFSTSVGLHFIVSIFLLNFPFVCIFCRPFSLCPLPYFSDFKSKLPCRSF